MGNEMLRKLSVKENLQNIKKSIQILCDMDQSFIWLCAAKAIVFSLPPYLYLWLSGFILDALTLKQSFKEIFGVTTGVLLICFVMKWLNSTIEMHTHTKMSMLYSRFEFKTAEKMMSMDYVCIDSPMVREIRERMNNDRNWGAGFWGVAICLDDIFTVILNVVGGIVFGIPLLTQMVKINHSLIWSILVLMGLVSMILIRFKRFFIHLNHKFMYEETEVDRLDFCNPLARGRYFNYQNGKDVRVYQGYNLLKRWTIDAIDREDNRSKMYKEGVIGYAGSGFLKRGLEGILEGGSYLIVAIMALVGNLSIGSVVKLAGCLNKLLSSLAEGGNLYVGFSTTAHQLVSSFEFFELEDEMYKGRLPMEKRSDNQYQIEFRDVSFKYPGSQVYALKNFSMKLKIGEKLAIVGMNGSGKTTMIKLLCRLYDPDEGEILLNGVNIKKFKQEEYSTLFSVVFQDYNLFPFKLGQNVALDTHYDVEKVEKCLQDAGFGDRLQEMPEGLDTYLYTDYDDSGVQISGGEAQKIALARAIYKDSPFILLDEPTAALDPLSEYEIYTHFDQIVGSKTAIYISHRLSSCRFCGKIAVFHEGRLVQLGSHKELVADTEGKYYEMWNAQAQYYREQGKGWESLVEEV